MGDNDSTANLLNGKTLGTCTLQRMLGRGGMGAVYLAQQSRPRRTVAVKVLLPELIMTSTASSEFIARFRREADAIATLDHINIMPIYEYGEQDQLAYLVMPYLSAGTLRDVVARRGKLPLSEATAIIEQIAAALDYAHQHGIIHRDLKPGNILFHTDGRLVLTDFGIAKVLSEPAAANVPAMQTLTSTGMVIGTPEYFSPEQATGVAIDHRTDIYSLGIVLFQLLIGRVPFSGTTPVAVAIKHATEMPPSLSQLNPTIPLGVEQVLLKAIAKKPEQRYDSAGEFARSLRAAVHETQGTNAHTFTTDSNPAAHVSLLSTAISPQGTILPERETLRDEQPTVIADPHPMPRRKGGRLPSTLALLSGILGVLVVLAILGEAALALHWLPLRNQQPSGSTGNQIGSTSKPTSTPTSTATAVHPQTTLPTPAIPVGKLLYGTSLPLCDAQSGLWSTNPSVQSMCDAADTKLTNTNTGQVETVSLNTLPENVSIPNDYVLQVQAQPVTAANGTFGVYFRTQSGANHQGSFSFIIQPSGFWNGNGIDDASGQVTSIYGQQGPAISSTSFTTIDIVVQGSTFQLYINGVLQGSISSTSYPDGKLGLAVGAGANVLFKNLAIYALP